MNGKDEPKTTSEIVKSGYITLILAGSIIAIVVIVNIVQLVISKRKKNELK